MTEEKELSWISGFWRLWLDDEERPAFSSVVTKEYVLYVVTSLAVLVRLVVIWVYFSLPWIWLFILSIPLAFTVKLVNRNMNRKYLLPPESEAAGVALPSDEPPRLNIVKMIMLLIPIGLLIWLFSFVGITLASNRASGLYGSYGVTALVVVILIVLCVKCPRRLGVHVKMPHRKKIEGNIKKEVSNMTIQAAKSTDSLKVLWILWVQSVASLGIYIVVARVGGVHGCINPGLSVEALRNALLVTTIVEFGLIQYLRKTMIAPRVSPSVSPTYENADRQHTRSYVAQYKRAVLTSLIISESVGFFGFILFVFGDSLNTLYMFVGISALYMLIYRPKSEELEQLQSSTVAAHST